MAVPGSVPRLLVVEDDQELLDLLVALLTEEGYQVHGVPTLPQALAVIESQTFDLIVTDLFAQLGREALASVAGLLERVQPTPVGILSAWPVAEPEALQRGFAFARSKPFDLTDLLTALAQVLQRPFTPEQEQQAEVVRAYFARLSARDWDGFVALCTTDVTYYLPGVSSFAGTISGQAALRAYTEATYAAFPDAWFEPPRIVGRPNGLATRFAGHWTGADGQPHQLSGAVLFEFAEGHIHQIGVRLPEARLLHLLAPPPQEAPGPG